MRPYGPVGFSSLALGLKLWIKIHVMTNHGIVPNLGRDGQGLCLKNDRKPLCILETLNPNTSFGYKYFFFYYYPHLLSVQLNPQSQSLHCLFYLDGTCVLSITLIFFFYFFFVNLNRKKKKGKESKSASWLDPDMNTIQAILSHILAI